ncbi:MAG: EAL domain-containing protein [Pseudomonadota bacterium]|nr:EAL domain-containing protein [Pseudomonadota bacterium]
MRISSIQQRILTTLGVMLLLGTALAMPSIWWLIDHRSRQNELDTASRDITRLQMLLAHRADAVQGWAFDYSNWNLAADYLRGKYPNFIADNIYLNNLESFDNDLVIIANSTLQPYAALATPDFAPADTDAEAENGMTHAPAELVDAILALPEIRQLLGESSSIGMYVPIKQKWYLIGAGSISYPDQEEDTSVHGVFVWVSELTTERIQKIADSAGFGFTLLPPPFEQSTETTRITGDDIVATRSLHDTREQINGGVQISYPRPFLAQMRDTRQLSIIAAIVAMILTVGFAWLMLNRSIVRRLLSIGEGLEHLRMGGSRLLSGDTQGDEIDRLALGINSLHVELSRANSRWQFAAQHDSLTQLGNREYLQEVLSASDQQADKLTALLLININEFRSINDLLGHEGGDRLLQLVADVLRRTIPGGAQAFRMGSDEFAVLFNPRERGDVKALASTLLASMARIPVVAGEGTLSARIGAACTELADATPIRCEELLHGASIALEHATANNRGSIAIYDLTMFEATKRMHRVELLLREALTNGEIEAWFQPIVSATDKSLVRLETLARWHNAELGRVDPGEFINIAERVGLAPQLDLWMLKQAAKALPKVRDLVPAARMSVNVSARSLISEDYLRNAPRVLIESSLTGQDIMLEITETALVDNDSMLEQPIRILREHGMHIQLDDFGVGYSSLSRLSQLNPAGLKLDGSFIRNRLNGGERICKAIIQLAQQLEIPITAEYVETDDDAEFLRVLGCQFLQGFLISRALPLPQLLEWIASPLRRTPR